MHAFEPPICCCITGAIRTYMILGFYYLVFRHFGLLSQSRRLYLDRSEDYACIFIRQIIRCFYNLMPRIKPINKWVPGSWGFLKNQSQKPSFSPNKRATPQMILSDTPKTAMMIDILLHEYVGRHNLLKSTRACDNTTEFLATYFFSDANLSAADFQVAEFIIAKEQNP